MRKGNEPLVSTSCNLSGTRSGRAITPGGFCAADLPFGELKANAPGVVQKLRLAMILNGVYINGWPGGTISAVHSDDDLERTIDAFGESLRMLGREDALPT